MPKRKTSKPTPRRIPRGASAVPALPDEAPFDPVTIRLICWVDGQVVTVPVGASALLQRAAMEWTYIVRNRRRWASDQGAVAEQVRRILTLAKRLDIPTEALEQLAAAEVIEVEVPYTTEDQVWEGRVFPWEHVLAAVTREIRNGRALSVVRRLRRISPLPGRRKRPVKNVLLVEATPGAIGEDYSFETERTLVQEAFSRAGATVTVLSHASLATIASEVARLNPEVIHVAGCDTHQGAELLDMPNPEHDGVCLDGKDGSPYHASSGELAQAIRNDTAPPLLVSFNMFNSAARTAALAVAEGGAEAAIGFQDAFSERFAEEFFAKLYWALLEPESERDLLAAFRFAWGEIRKQLATTAAVAGTGIVLWGASSWLASASAGRTGVSESLQRKAREQRALPLSVDGKDVLSRVKLKIKPYGQLNYSILHNRQRLFETFQVTKPLGRLENFEVSVQLYAGQEQIPYGQRFTLENETEELRDRITLPLTSTLLRTLRESVRSTVKVEVTCNNTILFYETMPVNLLAIDEWKDDDENRVWLPSFVLPRDPAVLRIVDAGQKYLSALVDDANAGFDGYQCITPGAEDAYAGVDQQAQALWWAIVSDFHPSYVNPPPTYSWSSQRLRSPTDIIEGRRGTCIDLALLFAACLEYIEIYPVIILLEGHAFPAYWRSDKLYDEFRQVRAPSLDESRPPALQPVTADGAQSQTASWYLRKPQYREILQSVRAGHLVPVETVMLTNRSSFADALDEGLGNLRSRAEFNSMLDVRLAREAGVTPLPFRGGQS